MCMNTGRPASNPQTACQHASVCCTGRRGLYTGMMGTRSEDYLMMSEKVNVVIDVLVLNILSYDQFS